MGLAEYEQIRQPFFTRMIAEKRARRVIVCDEVSAIFENHDTALLQIQEMLRTERISKEAAILHELETYNELVPGEGELSATMFIEIPERTARDQRLTELAGLEGHIALEVLGTTCPRPGRQPRRSSRPHHRGALPEVSPGRRAVGTSRGPLAEVSPPARCSSFFLTPSFR